MPRDATNRHETEEGHEFSDHEEQRGDTRRNGLTYVPIWAGLLTMEGRAMCRGPGAAAREKNPPR